MADQPSPGTPGGRASGRKTTAPLDTPDLPPASGKPSRRAAALAVLSVAAILMVAALLWLALLLLSPSGQRAAQPLSWAAGIRGAPSSGTIGGIGFGLGDSAARAQGCGMTSSG